MIKRSRYSYSDTIARLSKAIVDAGGTVFATIDQAAAARSAGLSLRPTSLLVFGNPHGGTPLMQAFPIIGLDLPLKVLVWEEDGVVNVAYARMSEIAQHRGIAGDDAGVAAMDRMLATVGDSVA